MWRLKRKGLVVRRLRIFAQRVKECDEKCVARKIKEGQGSFK